MSLQLSSIVLAGFLLVADTFAAPVDFTTLHHFGPTPSAGYWLNPLVAGRDGAIYGTTIRGGAGDQGTIYRLETNTGARSVLFEFITNAANGVQPGGPLIHGSDGLLYGWTFLGGTSNQGVIFRLDRNGSNYTVLRHLSQPSFSKNGINVSATGSGAMIEGTDGRLYLIPRRDEIARMDRDGGNYTVISTNAFAENEILEGQDGMLYLIKADVVGSAIYKMDKDGGSITTILSVVLGRGFHTLRQGTDGRLYGLGVKDFPSDGFFFSVETNGLGYIQRIGLFTAALQPGSFFQAADGFFYYSNGAGSTNDRGVLLRLGTNVIAPDNITHLLTWPPQTENIGRPITTTRLIERGDGRFYGISDYGGTFGGGLAFRLERDGSGFTELANFSYPIADDGSNAAPPVVLAMNGLLYGTTRAGGFSNLGVVYRMKPDGSDYGILHQFSGVNEGADPAGGVVDGHDGYLYGTTISGGTQARGTVFRIGYDGGDYSVLYNLRTNRAGANPIDPANPLAPLLVASDGFLYGVGTSGGSANRGGIFKAARDASFFTNLHSLVPGEGRSPVAALTEGPDGLLYGCTDAGGSGTNNAGTIFRLSKDGSGFQTLRTFAPASSGQFPDGKLFITTDGTIYGTTFGGGTNGLGTIFRFQSAGSNYGVLHHFGASIDGRRPTTGLVEAEDGSLIGGTRFGGEGAAGQQLGTLYKINKDGTGYEILRSFTGSSGDGESIFSTLAKGEGDTFYGTTALGGNTASGTVFTFTLGGAAMAPPVIIAQPVSYIGGSGGVTTLGVQATGTPPLAYQWFFRGIPVSGAINAMLTLTNSAADAGAYTVRVSNPGGPTNSAPAYVTLFRINADQSLTLHGPSGVMHRIDLADELGEAPQPWTPLTNVVLPVGELRLTDPAAAGRTRRFYRGVMVP